MELLKELYLFIPALNWALFVIAVADPNVKVIVDSQHFLFNELS